MRTYLVWCDYSQDGSLEMGSLRAVAIARPSWAMSYKKMVERRWVWCVCPFFSSSPAFLQLFFDGMDRLVSVARESRSCGGLLVQRSVGNRAVSRWEPLGGSGEDVVCVVCLAAQMVPLSQVQVNAARKGKTG